MKNARLATLALLISLTALAQQRPGGGPDRQDPDGTAVADFLQTINANAKNCPGSTTFQTTIDFQVLYNLHYAKEKSSPECGENGIPALFRCLLDKHAQPLLKRVVDDEFRSSNSSLSRHLKFLPVSNEDRKGNAKFLSDLSEKLEKKKD